MPNMRPFIVAGILAAALLAGCYRQPATPPVTPSEQAIPLTLVEENIAHDGAKISLGHRGKQARAGEGIEPVALITKDGQPVADAMVFNGLVSVDGKTVDEADLATIYAPPLYGQAKLPIPAGAKQCVVRFRVILADSDEEWTRDIVIDLN